MQTRIKQLFSPPVFDDEEQARLARSTYIIALTSLIGMFVAALIMLIVRRPIIACMLLAGAGLMVIAFWLTRRGQLQLAMTLFLLSILGIVTGVLYAGLGVHDVGVTVYPVVIIMASLLLKPRGIALIAVLSILSVGFVTLSELNGQVRLALPGATGWDDFAGIAAILIVTAIVGWLMADDVLRSLVRARHELVERKLAEGALRRAEEKYRSIVENAAEGIFQSTPDGRFLSVNPAMAHMYGYANPDDMIQSVTDITQQVYAEPEQRAYLQHRLEMEGVMQGFEVQVRRKDGSTFWTSLNVRIVRDEQGKTRYYEGTLEDISARKQAEGSLKQVNATLQALIDYAPLAIVMLDLTSQVLLWNKAAERMYGWTADEVLGKFLPNVSDDKLEEHLAIRGRVLSGESITHLEVERTCKDGSRIYTDLSIAPLRDSTGQIYAQMSIGVDITERKRAEETLQMFQYTIDRSSDAIQWLNREAGFEYVNDQACRSLGYTREELMHLHLWDIDPIYPKERWNRNWEGYQDGRLGGSENVETLHRRKDGSVFPVEVSSNHLWFGDRELHVAVVRDITERRRAEEALRRTQFVVDRAKDAIHWVDADGKLVYVNDSICRSLGYTREELLAMTVFDIDPVFPKETWPDHWLNMLNLGSYSFETVHKAKDGHTFPVEVSVDVMHFEGKEFHSVYARDITERRQTERLLHLRLRLMEFAATHSLAELLQKTLDEVGELTNSPIGFYHFVEADQRTLSLQAWSTRTLDEFCQAEGKGLHYPIDQAGVWTDCVRERRPVIHNDYQALPHRKGLPEGHAQVMRELVVPILRGDRIVAILGVGNKAQAYTEKDIEVVSYVADVAWEITERRRAEEEFVKLAKFPSENPYPVLRLDRDGMVLYANKASLGLLVDWGCAEGERAPEFWRDVVTEALGKQAMRIVETQSGGRTYSVSVVPIVDANYVNLYGSNITERKQAESQREKLIRELEAKNAELERFTYTVSHDLKSPLITIRGFLGLLEKDALAGDAEQMQDDMKRIIDATDKMQRLLNELLELSRVGRMMNPPEAMPFETIVREALALVRGPLQARGVDVQVAADLPIVHGDRTRLVEVVQNLVDNAVKFMGDQLQPLIAIGQLGSDDTGKSILFVQDNGSGIDRQYHDIIFGLFSKLDTKSEGTGVGLALVKRIIEVHGGRIWVESKGAKTGSTFYFTLPAN